MAEFKRQTVYFTVIGQGSLSVEYADGEETPCEAFKRSYSPFGNGEPSIHILIDEGGFGGMDFDHVITCATEPYPPERDDG